MGVFELLRGKARPPRSLADMRRLENFPVLSARELIAVLGQENRIRSIKQLSQVDRDSFDVLYTPAIHRFIEASQLQPASKTDHHAGLGGLVVHTLEVVEIAMKLRLGAVLPLHSTSDVVAAQSQVWTYAVFAGALLHDAGKLLVLTRLALDNDVDWSPADGPLTDTGASTYRIEWQDAPYELQACTSIVLFGFLPPLSRRMLCNNLLVLDELSGWLSSEEYRWGSLGDIVTVADKTSTSKDLQPGVVRERLRNVPTRSLPERMISALRSEIVDGTISLNRNGADGWFVDGYAYIVCKTAADRIRDRIVREGSSDVPRSNIRLFERLQEHGCIVPTETGKAVWLVRVEETDYCHTFTVLKFVSSYVIHASRRNHPFRGSVSAVTGFEDREANQVSALDDSRQDAAEPVDAARAETTSEPAGTPSPRAPESPRVTDRPAGDPEGQDLSKQEAASPVVEGPASPPSASAGPVSMKRPAEDATPEQGAVWLANEIEKAASRHWTTIESPPVALDHEDIARYFLSWLREQIHAEKLEINNPKAFVHVVPIGTLLVSPRVFHTFVRTTKVISSEERNALNDATKRIQNRLTKEKLAIPTLKRNLLHRLKVVSHAGMTRSTLHAVLVPTELLFGPGAAPEANTAIELDTTSYRQ